MKKILLVLVALAFIGSTLTGCSSYKALDKKITGEITMMLWSGDGTYIEDLGHKELTPADLKGQNNAAVYAVAKAFNAVYPNVKINVYAKLAGPNDGGVSWTQELENFKAEHGNYPDVYAVNDLVGDVARGFVADLSQFKNDPLYKSFNKAIMKTMNYYGFQAGLPQFMQPWGVYVNKALAEENNIDVPEPTWTIDEYTDFITSADNETFWGTMDPELNFIRTGVTTLEQQWLNYDGSKPFVNLNSDEVKSLLDYVPQWTNTSVWGLNDLGLMPAGVMDANWWWSHKFFLENKLLTNGGDPWMMGDCANPAEGHWAACKSTDWDIYPRPSTDYQKNTVGLVLDPMAVYNHCMDDGDKACSEEENAQIKLAYTFGAFFAGDTSAWQARADQMWLDGENEKSAMNDSLPLVTGAEFDKQMEIWYQPTIHQRFADEAKMPGWQEVLKIWKAGQMWSISDKAVVWNFDDNGASKNIIWEWNNIYNKDVAGALRSDANWPDMVKAKLADWQATWVTRYDAASQTLKDGLKIYYDFKDSDFE